MKNPLLSSLLPVAQVHYQNIRVRRHEGIEQGRVGWYSSSQNLLGRSHRIVELPHTTQFEHMVLVYSHGFVALKSWAISQTKNITWT